VENSFGYTLEEEANKFYNIRNRNTSYFIEYQLAAIEFAKLIPTDYPCEGYFTSGYGYRKKPWPEFHDGYDIANKAGTIIRATAPGIVVYSESKRGYGEYIEINHGYYTTIYGHMRKRLVNVGDEIKKNQIIGEMGSTGRSTGNHVHYGVKINNRTINPMILWNFNKDFMKPKWLY
jgi:murein DD-endopeptidase MepM/ murein hydrolase activator NlpD